MTLRIAGQLARSSAEVMTGLLADVHADTALGDRFEQTYLAVERSIVDRLLERATARGEISDRPDPATVHALLLGPLFAWLIMLDEDPALAPQLARTIAHSVTTALADGTVPPPGSVHS